MTPTIFDKLDFIGRNFMDTFLVVGLGNPGKKYEMTRHNVGWIAVDYIAKKFGTKIKKLKFQSTYTEVIENGKKIVLQKPQTFMNLSGQSVLAAKDYYNIPDSNIIIICDDISLPSNKLRIRRTGSDGGHNGLKSIIYLLESDQFPRIKIGVSDRQNPNMELADWVLGKLTSEEQKGLNSRLDDIFDAVMLITEGKTDEAMAKYNGDPK